MVDLVVEHKTRTDEDLSGSAGEKHVSLEQHTQGNLNDALIGFFNRRRLSPAQRRLANYVVDHPHEAPFLSSSELASRAGVSQPSVARLAPALGFGKYGELQKELRRIVLSIATTTTDDTGNKFQKAVTDEISNLQSLSGSLRDESLLSELGSKLASSSSLVVLGLRASAPMASYFGFFAEKIHPDVRVVSTGGSIAADQLSYARRAGGEWMLCFVLPRYPKETLEAMACAKKLGFRLATITDDQNAQHIARVSNVVLPARVGTQLVFDSQAAAMVLAGVLLEAIADASSGRTQARLENFEHRAAEMEIFATD